MDKILKFLDENTDDWEVYCEKSNHKSVSIEKGKIKVIESGKDVDYAVRVIVDGKVGFATASEISIELCEMAIKIAKVSEERLKEFPSGRKTNVEGIYDKKAKDVSSEWLLDKAQALINSVDSKVNPAHGSIEVVVDEVRLINSHVELEYKSTFCEAFLEVVYKDNSAFELEQSRMLKLDLEFIGRKASELVLMKSVKIEKGKYNVVLSPIAVHELLSNALYPSFYSENVMKGRSMLTEIGKKYIDITIIDDGTIPYGLLTIPFDDEGVESKRTVVFEDGILKSYITDFRHALEMGIEPTGNGLRGEDLYPVTSPTNVILIGEKSEDIVDNNTLIVHALAGAHTSNPVSGDFSLECMNAFIYRYGEMQAVKSAMIYGNVYDLLRRVEVFGKDVRQIENTITPSIRFKDVTVNV